MLYLIQQVKQDEDIITLTYTCQDAVVSCLYKPCVTEHMPATRVVPRDAPVVCLQQERGDLLICTAWRCQDCISAEEDVFRSLYLVRCLLAGQNQQQLIWRKQQRQQGCIDIKLMCSPSTGQGHLQPVSFEILTANPDNISQMRTSAKYFATEGVALQRNEQLAKELC